MTARYSGRTRHKLRVLLEELDAASARSGVSDFRGGQDRYVLHDWSLTARFLAPEVLLHLDVQVSGGVRRELPLWFTITEGPEVFDAQTEAVEAILKDPVPEVREAVRALRAHVIDYSGQQRAAFQRAVDMVAKHVDS